MVLHENLILEEIISRLPLNLAVQCKLLSKNFERKISGPEFSQIWLRRHKEPSTQLIYLSDELIFDKFRTISFNPITQCQMPLRYEVELLASSNGLILFDFEEIMFFCVFNPMTRAHQLIPYPGSTNKFGFTALAVDYPYPDQYKLVTISMLNENSNLLYKFHLLSSEQPGLWREFQLATGTSISLACSSPPVYWSDSLYWLRTDGSVLAFDTNNEEATLIDRPGYIDDYDIMYDKIITGDDIWLGVAQGLLILVCIFKRRIVISAYNNGSSSWSVSRTLDNFVSDPDGVVRGFPVWIDSKPVSFLVERFLTPYYDLYEYNTEINGYETVLALESVNYPMYCFYPTLASVHPSDVVVAAHIPYTDAKLDDLRRVIIEGISIQDDSSASSSSSSSSSEEDEEEVEEEQEEEEENILGFLFASSSSEEVEEEDEVEEEEQEAEQEAQDEEEEENLL